MTEHPILYSKQMILAKLNGWKTVTRRPVKQDVKTDSNGNLLYSWREQPWIYSPYGSVGDRLWTRENFKMEEIYAPDKEGVVYYPANDYRLLAQLTDAEWAKFQDWKYPHRNKSKLHMFRSLSRFLDEITEIGVERVQDITATDVCHEGLRIDQTDDAFVPPESPQSARQMYINKFKKLWQSMYEGGLFDWHENPWVWVVRYQPVHVNQPNNQTFKKAFAQ